MSTDTQTNTEQVQVEDLDNLLGMPGAESVMTPASETEESPKSFFTKEHIGQRLKSSLQQKNLISLSGSRAITIKFKRAYYRT